jgi:hypothetical protein
MSTAYDPGTALDVMSLSRRDFELWRGGYQAGLVHGIDRGREQADEEAQLLFDNAVRVTRAMARLEPWNDAQEARRARWAAAAAERAS